MTLHAFAPPTYDLELDLRYATSNNVTGKSIYDEAHAYLHADALEKLQTAIALAQSLGLRFKVFDAYRPIEGQRILFASCPDPSFVSNPDTGAIPHCRGVAIDLTLIDHNGQELDMGTGFDDFTPKSHHGNCTISTEAQHNRHLLLGIMTSAGWDFYRNEWWHYQLFTPRNYPVIAQQDDHTGIMK